MNDSSFKAALSISMAPYPKPQLVSAMSKLVFEFCRMVLEDTDEAARFHMAAHELAENVAKYSTGSRANLEVELQEVEGRYVMRVRAQNEASPERLAEVKRRLTEVSSTSRPVQLYDRLIRESAPRSDISGLGLARIRAEGELDVEYAINGSELTISVEAPVTPRESA